MNEFWEQIEAMRDFADKKVKADPKGATDLMWHQFDEHTDIQITESDDYPIQGHSAVAYGISDGDTQTEGAYIVLF